MKTTSHRKVRPSRSRKALRLGALATAGLGAVSIASSGPAQAFVLSRAATANDTLTTVATPGHETRFDDSFTVHQEGDVVAANLRNQALAIATNCTADDPCRSVSLSFQIVTMAGVNVGLINAVNFSRAMNIHCDGCQTLAGAYQFVVSTAEPFMLSQSALSRLAEIHAQLDALSNSDASATQIRATADELAGQVTSILRAAAATAPVPSGSTSQFPSVRVQRIFDQH